jgi:hypothetical protein
MAQTVGVVAIPASEYVNPFSRFGFLFLIHFNHAVFIAREWTN